MIVCDSNSAAEKKILSMLGLAARAGDVVSGEFATQKAVKSGKAFLVIVPADASDNTKKKFENTCSYYKTPIYVFGKKERLGHCIGKRERTSLALTDEGFADSIQGYLKDLRLDGGSEHGENENI